MGQSVSINRNVSHWYGWWGLMIFILPALITLFYEGLTNIASHWEQEEYSHGFLIPFISLFLAWSKRKELASLPAGGHWPGLVTIFLALGLYLAGELSSIFAIVHYAFILTTAGIVQTFFGWRGLKILAAPIIYLIFMVPIPDFLFNQISLELQLISSQFGAAMIRAMGITVFLDGNVIDLGTYQLLIVEACSGLRYLFPLMSFGFLCMCIFRIPMWQKLLVFVSTIPITIVMNSARIAIVGVLVQNYGRAMAEGFIHDFEGWMVFMACLAVLVFEVWVLTFFIKPRPKLLDLFPAEFLDVVPNSLPKRVPKPPVSGIVATLLLVVIAMASPFMSRPAESAVHRKGFETFPLKIEDWYGKRGILERSVADVIRVDDYVVADYRRLWDKVPVNLLITYYASQKKGASAHSPRSCIPGGGWAIDSYEERTLEGAGPGGQNLTVNRVVISKGDARQVAYYWFQQRDRILTNEYAVKFFIFWDALTKNRTDGALARVMTFWPEGENEEDVDARLAEFVQASFTSVADHLPQ